MIDEQLRAKVAQKQQQQALFKGFSDSVLSLKEDIKRINEQLGKKDTRSEILLDKIGRAIALVFNKIPKATELPKIFQVNGEVSVTNPIKIKDPIEISNLYELESFLTEFEKKVLKFQAEAMKLNKPLSLSVNNLSELKSYFTSLEKRMSGIAQAISEVPKPEMPSFDISSIEQRLDNILIAISSIKPQKIEVAKPTKATQPNINIPLDGIIVELKRLQDIVKSDLQDDSLPVMRKIQEGIESLVQRPVMTPQPVTNVNLNPLQGYVKTTSSIVGTSIVTLPNYGQLSGRRSVQIYNNSGNTIYIGGSDVTVSNGIPVLANSYSNIIDAGYNMIVYGIASQSGNNVRVLEVSKDQSGTVQE